MKLIVKAVAILSLLAGAAYAAPQRINGSDTLAKLTRNIIADQGLGSGIDPYTMTPPHCPDTDTLCYFGGGSGTGWVATGNAFNTGQGFNPSSRPIAAADETNAEMHGLTYPTPICEIGKDGVAILANSGGNGVLDHIKMTVIGNIFSCAQNTDGTKLADTWDKVPGSDPLLSGLTVEKYVRDGASGTTDVFVGRTKNRTDTGLHSFPSLPSPPDPFYWRHNVAFFHSTDCVRDCIGDGCTGIIGYNVANDPQGIGFAGLPALQTGNYALKVCDDTTNPCTATSEFIAPSMTTIEDGTYFYARTLYLGAVVGFPDPTTYSLPDSQQQIYDAECGAGSCDYLAPFLSDQGFFPAPRCL